MSSKEINRFIDIAKENHVTFSIRAHCSLVAQLHKEVHGFVPGRIEEILAELGDEKGEVKILLENNLKMPHKYSLCGVAKVLSEKAKEAEFRKSAVKQVVYMINKNIAKWVILEFIKRRKRETY